jgi:hypothetical protein
MGFNSGLKELTYIAIVHICYFLILSKMYINISGFLFNAIHNRDCNIQIQIQMLHPWILLYVFKYTLYLYTHIYMYFPKERPVGFITLKGPNGTTTVKNASISREKQKWLHLQDCSVDHIISVYTISPDSTLWWCVVINGHDSSGPVCNFHLQGRTAGNLVTERLQRSRGSVLAFGT